VMIWTGRKLGSHVPAATAPIEATLQ